VPIDPPAFFFSISVSQESNDVSTTQHPLGESFLSFVNVNVVSLHLGISIVPSITNKLLGKLPHISVFAGHVPRVFLTYQK